MIAGGTSATMLFGDDGNDSVIGRSGNDSLFGGSGNDRLNGGAGVDEMTGGTGNDLFFVDNAADIIVENAGGGTADRVLASVSFALAADDDIELLTTNQHAGLTAINLTGNDLAQTIIGNAGANVLNGGGGNDRLNGLDGNDTLNGGAGADALDGGDGNDLAFYRYANAGVIANLTSGGTGGDADGDTYTSIERLLGSDFADSLTGDGLNNVLTGGGGDDTPSGLDGNDTLNGGAGADTFVFASPLGTGNIDRIADFDVTDDMIVLDSAIFSTLTAGNPLSASAFLANDTGQATTADQRILYETDTGRLFYDADGDGTGTSVLFATLSFNLALTNADFFVF